MTDKSTFSQDAAAALSKAFLETNNGERWRLVEQALRLHRLSLAAGGAGAGGVVRPPLAAAQQDEDAAS